MTKKSKETHLQDIADTGKGDEELASLLTPGTASVATPTSVLQRTMESENEHRSFDTIPSAAKPYPSPANVFKQEDSSQMSRLLTLESQGRRISYKGEKPSGEGTRAHEGRHGYE